MPIRQAFAISISAILLSSSIMMSSACTESSLQDKLKKYYSSISAADTTLDAGNLPQPPSGSSAHVASDSGPAAIVGGTPRVVKDGFCGDGIINGSTEDCDGGAIQNTNCRDYGAISGTVTCQPNSCLYDISHCITPAVNTEIGGQTETCKCSCDTQRCDGGCTAAGVVGQSACSFQCQNDCVCQCEGKLEAHVQSCDFTCACTISISGNPECNCSLDECDLLATITPHIADIVSRGR